MSPKPKILLVDDEPRFIDSLENILQFYDYNCTKALTGSEAIALLKTHSFDLALLDVELPDMSGCDIARFIKASCTRTAAIMLTGVRTVETAVEAMKLGAYDFLSKPLNHEMLLKTLGKALQHSRLERDLQNSEQKFQILSEAAWEGIAIHEKGKIIEANKQFLEMFGYTHGDLAQGLYLDTLLNPASQVWIGGRREHNTDGTCTATGKRKDGTELPVEAKSRSIIYQNKPLRVWVVRDLTERTRAEKENLDLQKKLAEANKLNALGLMAGSVAHDLNNILTGIVSYPDLLLLQMDKSDKHYEQIRKIQAAGKRAAAVVSDLVAITRGRTQQKTVENINDLVLNYLNSLEHNERLVNFPNVVVQTSLRRDVSNVCCSPQHIHKLLLNLVGNALEAVGESGMVHVSTENCRFSHPLHSQSAEDGEEYIKLTVADDGPGIQSDDIDHIFDPFYSTKVMGKSGTGLGLSVVWNIVQDHDGWVEVKDNGPGAVFEVYLPATEDAVCVAGLRATKVVGQGKGEKILIIDDQAEQNEILEKALTDMGYAAYSVTSGEDAIHFLKSQPVDLLLLDMIMGNGINGRETLEIILKDYPDQKAIVVSGYAKREEIEKTRSLGVSHFMEKPVTLSKISTAIQQSLAEN